MVRIINTKDKERKTRKKESMNKKEVIKMSIGGSTNHWNQKESIRRICAQVIPDQWIQRFHVDIEAVSESNDWYIYTLIRIKIYHAIMGYTQGICFRTNG